MCHTLERLTQVWLKVALALWYLNILQFKPLHSPGVTLHGGISKAKLCEESVISLKKQYIKMTLLQQYFTMNVPD